MIQVGGHFLNVRRQFSYISFKYKVLHKEITLRYNISPDILKMSAE